MKIVSLISMTVAVAALLFQPFQPVMASILNPIVGGSIFSTGQNFEGQTGMGDEMYLKNATGAQLPGGATVVSVARGVANTWILASDGQVYGAGFNESGELGDGTASLRSTPVQFDLPGALTAVQVIPRPAGYPNESAVHVIASDGQVYSAGYNAYGEFGDGTVANSSQVNSTPSQFILPGGVTAVEVEASQFSTYVRGSDGNVYAAGYNYYGQLGDASTDNRTTPVPMILPGGVTAVDITVPIHGIGTAVYIKGSDGQIYAAGQDYGKFGNGTSNASESTPVRFQLPALLTAVSVLGNNNVTSVLASDGNVYSSGANYDGQLGDGTTTFRTTPVAYILPGGVTSTKHYLPMYATSLHVIGSDGNLYSAGYNDYGRFGAGALVADTNVLTPTPFVLPGAVDVTSASVTYSTIMAVGSDGEVYSAGYNEFGEFGDGTTVQQDDPVVMNLPGGVTAASVYQNEEQQGTAYTLTTGGVVYATGNNAQGEGGTGTIGGNILSPQAIAIPGGATVTSVKIEFWFYGFASFVGSDNNLYSVGFNKFGQAATGTTSGYVMDPEGFILPGGLSAVEVQHNNGNIYALASNGQVYGAGDNFYGQLGDGTQLDRVTPVLFPLPIGLSAVKIFFPSAQSVSVLASDGNVYSAGSNTYGNLGTGSVSSAVLTPTKYILPVGVNVERISETYGGTTGGGLARNMSVIGTNGVAYTAGANQRAQVGDGLSAPFVMTSTPQAFILPGGLTAVKVHNMDSITAVEASNGQLYMAGENSYGQLGNGTMTSTDAVIGKLPTRFQLPVGISTTRFDGTPVTSHVIGSDGELYGAGKNTNGELGDTTLTNRSVPVQFQLPGAITVRSVDDLVLFYNGFAVTVLVVASDDLAYASGYGPLGFGAQNLFQSTPAAVPMPGGLTVDRLITSFNPSGRTALIASDQQYYQSGANTYGQLGDGTTTTSLSLVKFQLPVGVTAVDAIPESNATIVLGSNGKVYVAGVNSSGWLGGSSNTTRNNVTEYNLPNGAMVAQIAAMLGNKVSVLSTPFVYGIGAQTFCDENTNDTQDPGEPLINGQTVNLYNSSGGNPTGAAIATYTTASYQAYEGTFFFDNLPQGEYVLGVESDSGERFSAAFTLSGLGDGWILGNSAFITTVSGMGQTGMVCGMSTVATPPTTPGSSPVPGLAQTGMSVILLAILSLLLMSTAVIAAVLLRKKSRPITFRA
jgi:alpha-tubulin suppressor-like RCC1 family protein